MPPLARKMAVVIVLYVPLLLPNSVEPRGKANGKILDFENLPNEVKTNGGLSFAKFHLNNDRSGPEKAQFDCLYRTDIVLSGCECHDVLRRDEW
jgi:hypothetical protein